LFQGKQSLFEGLWIANRWDWASSHPVIRIDFNTVTNIRTDLSKGLADYLDLQALLLGVELQKTEANAKLLELIVKLYQQTGQKVVVLVDEYDKPMIELLGNVPQALENREILHDFYTILKGSERFLRFVLLTGVSKFSKLSLFSGLNNLVDVSLDPAYSSLLGYTRTELDQYFGEYIQAWAEAKNSSYASLRAALTDRYNGYSWSGSSQVFNPWSVMSALKVQKFGSYWYSTGTPSFLMEVLKSQQVHLPQLEGFGATKELQDAAALEQLNAHSLLWQTGYLTVKEVKEEGTETPEFLLGFPTREVRESLLVSYLSDGWPNLSSWATETIQ